MSLSQNLIDQFAKLTKKEEEKKEVTVRGTYKKIDNVEYVQLDGSDILTPVTSTVEAETGEKVNVLIKNHTATVTGNISSPSARNKSVQDLKDEVDEYGNTIKQLDNSILQQGNSIIQINNAIKQQENTINQFQNTINQQGNTIQQLDNVINQQGDQITSLNNTIVSQGNKINSMNNTIEEHGNTIKRHDNTIIQQGNTISQQGNLIEQQGNTIKQFDTDITTMHSSIEIFNSAFKIENGVLTGLSEIVVNELETNTLNAKYANIDFTNIGEAAIKNLFTDSGIIKNLIMSDGKVTGELVGVTIKGDLIEGNTLKADKLVILGENGLYYKLNVNALGEATASSDEKYQNGLDGSIIVTKSLTAEKIAVDDLVAFGATIGGYHIDTHSLYSGVKSSATNTTKGVFLGDDGQFAVGDSNNFLRFFKDTDGTFKLEIKSNSIKFGASDSTIEEVIEDVTNKVDTTIKSTEVEYYLSTSQTSLSGGSWSTTAPQWVNGKYMWSRTKITLQNGLTEYKPSENGTCISGATGPAGSDGKGIVSTKIEYTTYWYGDIIPKNGWSTSIPEASSDVYLWTRITIKYSDNTETYAYSVSKMGEAGRDGDDGVGIRSSEITYQAGSSGTEAPTDEWTDQIPSTSSDKPYLWTKIVTTYTNNTTSTSYSVGSTPEGISIGARNLIRNSSWIADDDYESKTIYLPNVNNIKNNETYTLSLYYNGNKVKNDSYDSSPNGYSYIYACDSNGDDIYGTWFMATVYPYETTRKVDNPDVSYFDVGIKVKNCKAGDEYKVKLELGNKATDWTPAPEDIDNSISNIENNVDNRFDEVNTSIQTAQSSIEQLSNMISHLVTDSNGSSLMTQTSDGWTFNMSSISDNLTAIQNAMENAKNEQNSTNSALDKLTSLVNDVANKTAYITMSMDEFGAPCIELGKSDSLFKVRITNTSIDFLEGSTKIAYANNRTFYVEKMIAKNELQIGEDPGFVWKTRSNGNLGLTYLGDKVPIQEDPVNGSINSDL